MKRLTKLITVSLLVFAMLLVGLLLPTLVERLAGGTNGASETVSVEPLRFDGGNGSVFEILQHMNQDNDINGSIISTQELTEGYHYNTETARVHAKELIVNYLNDCGLKESASYYEDSFDSFDINQEAVMVAAADYPVPWSAIIWTVECYNGTELMLVFDDASGSMLGCSLPLYEGITAETFTKFENQYTETCIRQFALQLGGEVSYDMSSEPMNHFYRIVGADGDSVGMGLMWYWSENDVPVLVISSEIWSATYDAAKN